MHDMNASAVILAGGESRRMGFDKAWMKLDGKPLLELAVAKVRELGIAEVFISGRAGVDYSVFHCPILIDLVPGFGPLGGIERGLQAATSPRLLVLAVDLPHMTTQFLQEAAARCDRLTGVVPEHAGQLEPLAAIYPRRCHALALDFIASGRPAACDFAETCLRERAVRTFPVPPRSAACFANWNRVVDTASAGSRFQQPGQRRCPLS
jgi:molybdopterin-guanine dinucleotide biosynthesis protein A